MKFSALFHHFLNFFGKPVWNWGLIKLIKVLCKTKLLFTATLSAISIATPNINTVIYTNFFKLFEIFVLFELIQTLMSKMLLWGLIIGYCIVSCGNEVVLNIITSRILIIFVNQTWYFLKYFLTFFVIIHFFQPQGARSLIYNLLTVYRKYVLAIEWNSRF